MSHGCKIGSIKVISVFDKEGSSETGVKVSRSSHPEMLVWINACTDEVSNCRQIATINTVILIDDQNNEISESSGELVAKYFTLIVQGRL